MPRAKGRTLIPATIPVQNFTVTYNITAVELKNILFNQVFQDALRAELIDMNDLTDRDATELIHNADGSVDIILHGRLAL